MRRLPFVLILLTSCISFSKKDVNVEPMQEVSIKTSVENAKDNPDFDADSWPEENWWTGYQDKQLDAFMETALENNPSLLEAKSKLEVVKANALGKRSPLLPHVSALASDNYAHLSKSGLFRFPPSPIPAVINQIQLGFNFKWELDLFGKNRKVYEAALGLVKAQKAEEELTKLMISTSLTNSYISWQINLEKLQVLEDLLEVKQEDLVLANTIFQNGLLNLIDVNNAEVIVEDIKKEIAAIKNNIEIDKNAMKLFMGLSTGEELEFEKPTISYEKKLGVPENAGVALLARRPEIMAQIWVVESKALEIGSAKAAFYPNVNLLAVTKFNSLHWSNFFSLGNLHNQLNPAITLPIFEGGKLRANLKGKIAEFEMETHKYNGYVLDAAKEVTDNINTMNMVTEKYWIEQRRQKVIDYTLELETERFTNGIVNLRQVLAKKADALQEIMVQIDIDYAYLLSSLQIIKSLGGGYQARDYDRK